MPRLNDAPENQAVRDLHDLATRILQRDERASDTANRSTDALEAVADLVLDLHCIALEDMSLGRQK
eukprot:CAMPEP_0115749842 /NCGR_PEP_ID=MMETSP0272-20121206/94405_1 /TAXON_ID=71861 /ORGANISM="Scrippsiella trochoidea, Strain CCMP3099" /LENGTH=65 /DNA_ID=CAMNT_0003194915 /DNA_START=112 /DNA_END=307 /DNA_ORIENTATION=+